MSHPRQQPRDAVVLERLLPIPPEQVWPLWTVPDRFAAWYGPPGAVVTVRAMDVRVGGDRRVSMTVHTPAGERVMHFAGVHLTVEMPHLLAYTEAVIEAAGDDPDDAATEVNLALAPDGTGTRLTLTHFGIPAGSPGETGWSAALDKLVQTASR